MASESHLPPHPEPPPRAVEMPRPTVAPLVLSLGLALLLGGVALGIAFVVVGAGVLAVGVGMWIVDLLPGRGHIHEPLVEPAQRPAPIASAPGMVEQLLPGVPGYRVQLPEKVRPISAGVKGGIAGGVVIVVPALIYGLVSRHGPWYPVNLLAGMVLPGLEDMSVAELEQFNLSFAIAAGFIHATMSVVFGLLYGVLLPMLPDIRKPLVWGGLLMPMLWTGVTFLGLKVVNTVLDQRVGWPSFIFAQFIFGVAAALVVMRAHRLPALAAGSLGGLVGGALMPLPAILWGLATGHGIWYPVNLLAGVVVPDMSDMPPESLQQFHANWFAMGLTIHFVLSVGFGMVYGFALPKLPAVPGPMSWGGLLMPLLWTAASFGLMGVVNPVLQQKVDWPWFIVSQFIFGVVASVVVVRSQEIPVPPAGPGPTPT